MNKISAIILGVATAAVMAACSSSPKTELDRVSANQNGQERVISRIDEMDSRPSWLKEEKPFTIEGDKVYSIGMTQGASDSNISALYRIAESNAKAAIANSIESRLEFIFQNAEEGTSLGTSQAQFIGAEASKLTSNSLRLSRRYWEKINTVVNGQISQQYRVFVLIEMPEADFKVAITDAIRRNQGKGGISAKFADKVDRHWDSFVGADADKATPEKREPSGKQDAE